MYIWYRMRIYVDMSGMNIGPLTSPPLQRYGIMTHEDL
jgi:hypothetical protein